MRITITARHCEIPDALRRTSGRAAPCDGPVIVGPLAAGLDVQLDDVGVVAGEDATGRQVNPQVAGIDACAQAIKLMELTLSTNS